MSVSRELYQIGYATILTGLAIENSPEALTKAEALLKQGANPNLLIDTKSALGETNAIREALKHGETAMTNLLMQHGALPDSDNPEKSAIVIAAKLSYWDTVLNFKEKLTTSRREILGRALFHAARVMDDKALKAAEMLVKMCYVQDVTNALCEPAKHGNIRMSTLLLNHGALPFTAHPDTSAIVIAAKYGNWDIVLLCKEKFPLKLLNHSETESLGRALLHAARFGEYDVAKMLIESGANVNHFHKHYYANNSNPHKIIDYCRDLNYKLLLPTPLHLAMALEDKQLVELLISNGAIPKLTYKPLKGEFYVTSDEIPVFGNEKNYSAVRFFNQAVEKKIEGFQVEKAEEVVSNSM